MLTHAINVFRVSRAYCDSLVEDIAPEDFCKQPVAGLNHPAWIVGHLAVSADRHGTFVGGVAELTGWKTKFGFGSEMSADPADYPDKATLIAAWHAAHDRYIAAAQAASPELLAGPNEYVRPEQLPTLADFITFSMTAHTAIHLGQLSAWRRADGRAPLF
ncbi:MAG: DinB family protein [Planctomycetota bacterium]